jgi:PEP-CTERM motif
MKKTYWAGVAALAGVALGAQAHAATMPITFSGPGVSGSLSITFGPGTDATYPNGFEITGVTGRFTDTNNGLGVVNAPIISLVPINHATPGDPKNIGVAPNDFSMFSVASGLPPVSNGVVTYDNLFWPGGSPPVAWDFDGAGGFLDIYGLAFTIGGGVLIDLFDNGVGAFSGMNYGGYGVVVANADTALDYVSAGVAASTPEPSTWAMMVLGFGGLGFAGYRASRNATTLAA